MQPTLGNLWRRFFGLRPDAPQLVGTITVVSGGGSYVVNLTGGGTQEVRGEGTYTVGDKVFVQGGRIIGEAPSLTSVVIEV